MDWYCAEYEKVTLYELHNGQTALGLEALDEVLMTTLDPTLISELEDEWTKVMAQSDNEEAKNKAKAEVDRIFVEIDAKRLRLDSKKADDSFVLGEHKIQSSSAASKPGAAQVEGNQGGR